VWSLLDHLANLGRLRAPYLVKVEVTKNKDHIGLWADAHPSVFRPKGEHASIVLELLKEPGQKLVTALAHRGGEEADPWVIALAVGINQDAPTLWAERDLATVVSEEAKPGGIREICARQGVDHMDLAEMLVAEGVTVTGRAPSAHVT
jgi:Domain of unknown function (DUF4411)